MLKEGLGKSEEFFGNRHRWLLECSPCLLLWELGKLQFKSLEIYYYKAGVTDERELKIEYFEEQLNEVWN